MLMGRMGSGQPTLIERMERLKYLGGSVKEMDTRSLSHSAVLPCTSGSYS